MTSIGILGKRVINTLGVVLDTSQKDRRLAPLTNCAVSTQLAIYWLRLCNQQQELPSNVIIQGGGEEETEPVVPTLLGFTEHIEYLTKEFKALTEDLNGLIMAQQYSPSTTYHLQKAYDALHESAFYIELTTNYYEQLARR